MKIQSTVACLALAFLAGPLRADSPQEAAVLTAAMKLPDAHNYSWTTEVVDDARSYTIAGKTDRADPQDLSTVTMPTVAAFGRIGGGSTRGRGSSGSEANAVFQGDEHFVIETPDGWKNPDELTAAARANRGNRGSSSLGPGGGSWGGGMGGWGGGGGYMGGRRGRGGRGGYGGGPGGTDANGNPRPTPAYSNLQSTLSRPHEEIAILVAGYTDLTTEGDVVSGKLSETGAKLLLVHPGQKEITPVQASGTFRLWVKDGTLVKYEVKLEGRLAVVTPGGGRHEIDVHQTTTTTLRDVDATKLEVPDAAKKKLGA